MNELLEIGNKIHENLNWLDGRIVRLADEAMASFSDADYSGACNHSGSALEILCGQIIEIINGQKLGNTSRTLGDFYSAPKGQTKNDAPLQSALLTYGILTEDIEAVVHRLIQASRIRNKGSHGIVSEVLVPTQGDALQILNILGLLVQWFEKTIVRSKTTNLASPDIHVFLSVGTPHRLDQKQFIEKLRYGLLVNGVALLNLSTGEYSDDKPFDQIKDIMSSCDGVLVVGWERFHAYTMIERERSPKHNLLQDLHLATAWNQIEGSMAVALGLPLLILREIRLHPDGIFEGDNHDRKIVTFDLLKESINLSEELMKQINGWVGNLRKKKANREGGMISNSSAV